MNNIIPNIRIQITLWLCQSMNNIIPDVRIQITMYNGHFSVHGMLHLIIDKATLAQDNEAMNFIK